MRDILRERIKQKGEFSLFLEMYRDDKMFHHCFCMSSSEFEFLLSKLDVKFLL